MDSFQGKLIYVSSLVALACSIPMTISQVNPLKDEAPKDFQIILNVTHHPEVSDIAVPPPNKTFRKAIDITYHSGSSGEVDMANSEVEGNISLLSGNQTEQNNNTKRYVITTMNWMATEPPYVAMLWVIMACIVKAAIVWNPMMTKFMPESCLVVMVGFVIGLCIYFSRIETHLMDSEAFFIYLLPPVIIESGYFMPKRTFFDNIGTVLWFAVIATLWATFSIAFSLWGFSRSGHVNAIHLELDMVHCLTYGGLIAAVDPVAVLATFEEIHVNEVLHIIVFGESLLNDGVTVVMFNLLDGFSKIGRENIISRDIGAGVGSFFLVGFGGTAIGVIVGFVGSLAVRFAEKLPLVEPLLVIAFCYLTYLTPEIFNLSAILGCVFGCITLNKYCEPNLSKKSHTVVKYFIKMVAAICETIIFLFLGCYIVNDNNEWETGFVLLNLVFCLAWRSCGVLVLTPICNWFRNNELTMIDQFIMAYGGIRGGIAFALASSMDATVYPQKKLFMTATAITVYYTVFVLGITIKPLVMFLKVKKSDKHKPSMCEKMSVRVCDHLMAGVDFVAGTHGHNDARLRFQRGDRRVLKHIVLRTKNRVKPKGTSIVSVFEKLLEKDAYEYIQREQSFVSNSLGSSMSLSQLWRTQSSSDLQMITYSESRSVPIAAGASILDFKAIDAGDEGKTYEDAELHHILSENMFQRTERYTMPRVYTMNETSETDKILKHKAHIHLQKLVRHQRSLVKRRSRRGSHRRGSSRSKNERSLVVPQTSLYHEPEKKPTYIAAAAEKEVEDSHSLSSHSDGGIEFAAHGDDQPGEPVEEFVGAIPYTTDDDVTASPRTPSPTYDSDEDSIHVSL